MSATGRLARPDCLSPLDEAGFLGLDGRLTLEGARNATLWLRDPQRRPRTCTDFVCGYAAVNFGHHNPRITRDLTTWADIAAFFYPPDAAYVAEWLAAALGGTGRRVLYQVGGSFAVSAALALARANRRGRIAAVEGSFHGLGVDTQAVTHVQRELALHAAGHADLLAGEVVHIVPGQPPPDWDGISCFLYEPVQGANGYIPLDPQWLAVMEKTAHAAGVVCIADEIQAGFYRFGHLSPARAMGLDPDILLYSKSLTNGIFPLSAVVYYEGLDVPLGAAGRLAHTFQTAALGFAAARGVAGFLDEEPMAPLAAEIERQLREAAGQLAADGTATEIHVTGPALSFEPTGAAARTVAKVAFDLGVLLFTGGSHGQRVRVAPPLTIPPDLLAAGLSVIREAAAEAAMTASPLAG